MSVVGRRTLGRRRFLGLAGASLALTACGRTESVESAVDRPVVNGGRWAMPGEEAPHEATWMAFPSSTAIWGASLPAVQEVIAALALTVAAFEPVRLLARPEARARVGALVGGEVEVLDAPVDDLWARDTLPLFLLAGDPADDEPLAAARLRFNGWGGAQRHRGDRQLAALVAEHLGVRDPGVTGEGGGIEVDGAGTALAARSSWDDPDRNPGWGGAELTMVLADLLGVDNLLWVDGIAGADITDGHIDTLARFAGDAAIVHERVGYHEPGETWFEVAAATERQLRGLIRDESLNRELVTLVQPSVVGGGPDFLSSYLNHYVCNGAVIVPEFGDREADAAAASTIADLHPGRSVVTLRIDAVAAGGGGIHCATQQQPSGAAS